MAGEAGGVGLTNVVQLRPAQSRFEDAWAAFPEQGRRRSSKKLSGPLWAKVAKEVGEDELLAAVQRYVREDKDYRRECGPPGFDRWLKWGRYEHWLGGSSVVWSADQFPDKDMRAKVVAHLGEPWCVSYLDPARLEGTTLIVKTEFAVSKFKEHAAFFRSLGLTGMRKAITPTP